MAALFGAAALAATTSCSEPDDRSLNSVTGDHEFELVLVAEQNWVRAGETLPIRVGVTRLIGPPLEDFEDSIRIFVSNGSVTGDFSRDIRGSLTLPLRLSVSVPASTDSTATGPSALFSTWISFTPSSAVSAERQGQVHAAFRDALTTLDIRIVPRPESL